MSCYIKNIEDFEAIGGAVVSIGTFDGVHIGHQKIIKRLVSIGKQEQLKSIVLTFFPHPRMVLQKDTHIKLVNTMAERGNILEKLGLDCLVVQPFTKTFSRLTAEDFVRNILVERLNAKKIIVGYDHRFGRNRTANLLDLKTFGKACDFDVEEVSAQECNAIAVSSTKIRKALGEGDMDKANRFLGAPFTITGTVVEGKGLGRTLHYPTANIYIKEDYKLIPKRGAYVVKTLIDGDQVYGMMNIGVTPTLTLENTDETIEVHLFGIDIDLYHKMLHIDVLHRIRDEIKFKSVAALKTQLESDKHYSQHYIKSQH